MNKKKLGLIFGGKSAEHEISIRSARNIFNAINKDKYEVVLIGVDKKGEWFLSKDEILFDVLNNYNKREETYSIISIALNFGDNRDCFIGTQDALFSYDIDVAFPIIHGTYGEDGCMQGLLKMINVPFVGPSVLGSAVAMDKDVMRQLFKAANIPGAKTMVFYKHEIETIDYESIESELRMPVFIKPANLGSSVGISKAKSKEEVIKGIKEAFLYDNKVVVEEFMDGHEVECAVLGNENPLASTIGEIETQSNHEFYSYDAKYIDKDGAKSNIPVDLPKEKIDEIRNLSVKAYKVLNLEGMARVDCFVNDKGIFLNEVNTLPGFTSISMYPKLFEFEGISQTELIDKLINLAFSRFEKEKSLKSSFI